MLDPTRDSSKGTPGTNMGTNYIASCFPTSPSLTFLALPNSAHLVQIVARTQPNSRVPSADAPGTICIAFLSILAFHPPAGKLKIYQPTHRSLRGFQYTSPVNEMIDPGMSLQFTKKITNLKITESQPNNFHLGREVFRGGGRRGGQCSSVEGQKDAASILKQGSILFLF